jgi:hypothetical protein
MVVLLVGIAGAGFFAPLPDRYFGLAAAALLGIGFCCWSLSIMAPQIDLILFSNNVVDIEACIRILSEEVCHGLR